MKMDKIANSKNDEFYTPTYAVYPLVKYLNLKNYKIIWCPFDLKQSNFVTILTDNGFTVINTHIEKGEDFFNITPPVCDCIISNPPYSMKTEILDRLFSLNKPFAMLLGIAGLFESQKRFNMFASNKFEIMYLNKRVAYHKNYDDLKPTLNPPFSSVYVCQNVLPQPICFEKIVK